MREVLTDELPKDTLKLESNFKDFIPGQKGQPGFMMRIPLKYREPILKLIKRSRRTMTEEVSIALEIYLRSHNLWASQDD